MGTSLLIFSINITRCTTHISVHVYADDKDKYKNPQMEDLTYSIEFGIFTLTELGVSMNFLPSLYNTNMIAQQYNLTYQQQMGTVP